VCIGVGRLVMVAGSFDRGHDFRSFECGRSLLVFMDASTRWTSADALR